IQPKKISTILAKITQNSITLEKYLGKISYGIKTGFNEAFIINEENKNQLILEDAKSIDIIKPYLIGSEISRYSLKLKNHYIILVKIGVDLNRYPAIKKWLFKYELALKKRWDKGNYWYELRACAYYDSFEKPKIIWGNLAIKASFTYDEEGYYINAPACIIPTTNKFILGILNSKLISYFLKSICAERQGGFIEQKPIYVSKVPIKEPQKEQKEKLIKIVDKILSLNKHLSSLKDKQTDERIRLEAEIKKLDNEIDQEVYKLYGLNNKEIRIIEESLK
ncbi:MAG: restriction endonuclease subunit R, partial [Nanoarchaeota archaeon]|nr:restriction endonuclease subunit R [Nanoarchaeota archaeon]